MKEAGKFDNTAIFLISDNGAAPEADANGWIINPYRPTGMTIQDMLKRLDDIGTERSQPLYPRPWAMAGNAPFKYYKLWHDGWKAVAIHQPGTDFSNDRWELYDLTIDFSESTDLAAKNPDKLKQLQDLWWSEAEKYGVLPINTNFQIPNLPRR